MKPLIIDVDHDYPSDVPIIYPDSIMSPGSLFLIDFSHPSGYDLGSTLPSNDVMIPNIAWETAADIIGSGSRSSLSPRFKQSGLVGTSSAKHKLEWTPKKGLHGIISKSPGIASGDHMRISYPDLIFTHIFNHSAPFNAPALQDRKFYISMVRRVTRAYSVASSPQPYQMIGSASTNALGWNDSHNGPMPSANQRFLDGSSTIATGAAGALGIHFSALETNAWTGTKPGSPAIEGQFRWSWLWGSFTSYAGFNLTVCPSQVIYRLYVEDLYVSGRTFAQVRDIDYALYQKAFAEDGKYYGDTLPTDPATIP